jgi:hypothetical protein
MIDKWILGLSILLLGCLGGEPMIAVKDAYVIPNPGMKAVSAFMSIENTGTGKDALIGASIRDYPDAMVMLHSVKEGKMVMVEKIDIPAKKTVQLKPGGYHIMGLKIENPKTEGELTIVLKFKHSGEIVVQVPVRGG